MAPSVECPNANPDVIRFCRESLNLSIDVASRAFDIEEDVLAAIESGDGHPSLSLLRKMAVRYKRPIAMFFLPNAPPVVIAPTDFRTRTGPLGPQTLLAIRRARNLQRNLKQLGMDGGVEFWAKNDRPSVAADLARTWLGISHEQQIRSRDSSEFFNLVINALDRRAVQVLRLQFPATEAKAFCLGDSPKVIVVTTNDNVVGSRIFSTFHELGHLSLGESSICLTLEDQPTNDIERYCDLFATELLMPTRLISNLVGGLQGTLLADAVDELADLVKSSKTALLIKFKQMELIDEDELQIKLAELRARNPRQQQGRSTRTSIVLKEQGLALPRLVFNGLKSEALSPIEASRYLNLNQGNLIEVGSRLGYL